MWIRTGTVDVTNGSAVVIAGAAATMFETEQVLPGYLFIGPDGRSYEVLSVQSEAQLTLAEPYAGATAADQAYRVAQLVAAANASVLNEVLDLLELFRTQVDLTKLAIGGPTVDAPLAFLGALASFENSAGLTVRLSKGTAGDTSVLEFATGGAGKTRLAAAGKNNLVVQYYNGAAWVTVITVNAATGVVSIPSLQNNLGTIFTPRGEWSSGTTYALGDLVSASSGGDSYVFVSGEDDNTGNAPPFSGGVGASNAHWTVLGLAAAPGEPGPPGSSDVVGTSTSSVAIAAGSKTFAIVEDNRGWGVGARVRATSAADPSTHWIEGVVTSYAGSTLQISADLVAGAGSRADWTINLVGERGAKGDHGTAATIAPGEVTMLEPDAPATVGNSGTSSAAVFDFGIPRGNPGAAATIEIGTVTTLGPGEDATVDNSGTDAAVILDFGIPRGAPGDGSGDVVGPAGAVSGNFPSFAGSTGKVVGDSGKSAADFLATALKGAADGVAELDGAGKVPVTQLPAVAITDTSLVASQSAMLALTAEVGDIAVRTDINKTFVLAAEPASTLANWVELRSPTDLVQSVAGKTGVVTLVKGDVGLGNVDNTADTGKPVSTAQQTALDAKEPLGEYSGVNDQTGTTYTFALSDKSKLVSGNNAGAQTFTVPPNSSVAFPIRSRIDLWQKGAGQITIAAGSGVTINSSGGKLKLSGQYSGASLIKIDTDEWLAIGDLAS